MATTTAAIVLTTSYQAMTSTETNILMRVEGGRAQVLIAASAPSDTTDNWYPLDPGNEMNLINLSSSDVVYARALDGSATGAVKMRILRK